MGRENYPAHTSIVGCAGEVLNSQGVNVSSGSPVERLGMRPMLASMDGQEVEMVPVMERKGPEFMSSNPQMQMLTCFGHCGADCQVCIRAMHV